MTSMRKPPGSPARPIPLRIRERSKVDAAGCWLWQGRLSPCGYGLIGVGSKLDGTHRSAALAHRISYEAFIGPIAEGMVLDHLCRNRSCVNPAHLQQVTHTENVLRGVSFSAVNAKKTHCVNGHEFSPANTNSNGRRRQCRACWRAASKRAADRRRKQVEA